MRNFDIGFAMVAARIASSEIEREQAIREKRKKKHSGRTLEVVRGEPSPGSPAEPQGVKPFSGWTRTRQDGSVVRIGMGEAGHPPGRERKTIPSK